MKDSQDLGQETVSKLKFWYWMHRRQCYRRRALGKRLEQKSSTTKNIEIHCFVCLFVVVVFRIFVLGIGMHQSRSPSRDEGKKIWGHCSHRNRRSLCLQTSLKQIVPTCLGYKRGCYFWFALCNKIRLRASLNAHR